MTPTTPTPDDLRALLAKASPGPWYALGDGDIETADRGFICTYTDRQEANAALIVAAVNSLPSLLDSLAAAEGENARLRGLFESEAATFHLTQQRNDAIARAEAAEAELARVRPDANRYVAIRDGMSDGEIRHLAETAGEQWDALIDEFISDAALAPQAGGSHE